MYARAPLAGSRVIGSMMTVRMIECVPGTSEWVAVTADLGSETIRYHCPIEDAPKIHDRIEIYVGENHGRQR